jgi:hypothetical protein
MSTQEIHSSRFLSDQELHIMCDKLRQITVDPRMNRLIGGVGGPIMPIVRYYRIVYI